MHIQTIIMFQQKNEVAKDWSSTHSHLDDPHKPVNLLFKEIPAINLKKAIIDDPSRDDVLGEMIAIAETAFAFIYYSNLDLPIRNAMYQLEKQFDFYRRLLGR